MPPEVLAARLAFPMVMSRPELMLIAACVGSSPALLVCRLPFRKMSLAPIVTSRIVPPTFKAPSVKAPRLRVKSTLPVGENTPPVWLKSVLTVIAPLPPKLPTLNVTDPALSVPLAVSVPPMMLTAWVNDEVPPSVNEPPERMKFSLAVNWLATANPPETVMVCSPATLTNTVCPAAGTIRVLQLAPVFQLPEVPIQQTSTVQPPDSANCRSAPV